MKATYETSMKRVHESRDEKQAAPTDEQLRHVAREWALHFGGTCSANARVRRVSFGALVMIEVNGHRYARRVTTEEAFSGRLSDEWLAYLERSRMIC